LEHETSYGANFSHESSVWTVSISTALGSSDREGGLSRRAFWNVQGEIYLYILGPIPWSWYR